MRVERGEWQKDAFAVHPVFVPIWSVCTYLVCLYPLRLLLDQLLTDESENLDVTQRPLDNNP